MIYEIEIRTSVNVHMDILTCSFWFENPLTNKDSFVSEYKRGDESSMDFVNRIKEFINTNEFLIKIKDKIIRDVQKHNKEKGDEVEFNTIQKELGKLKFNVKVEIN